MSDTDVRRTRVLVTAFTLAATLVMIWTMIDDGPDRIVQNLARTGLLLALCFGVLRGSSAARWITVSLLGWGVLVRIAILSTPGQMNGHEWARTGVFLLICLGFIYVLVLSPSVHRYFEHQRASPKSGN